MRGRGEEGTCHREIQLVQVDLRPLAEGEKGQINEHPFSTEFGNFATVQEIILSLQTSMKDNILGEEGTSFAVNRPLEHDL